MPAPRMSRRQFVRRVSAMTAATWAMPLAPHLRYARAQTAGIAVAPAGTTLQATFVPTGAGPYFALTIGPSWPIIVRDELATPVAGREDRREPIATIAHLTDIHLLDAQSPARVEFMDRDADPPLDFNPTGGAWRAQEVLCTQVGDAMIQRINTIGRGPVAGRTIDVAVSTGDNIDNQQYNEALWFMALLDGLPLRPNSGADGVYEGVQDTDTTFYDSSYWHPDLIDDPRAPDDYKSQFGFPDYPGLMEAGIAAFVPTGIKYPWYSTYGNHDGLAQGNAPANEALNGIAVGPAKVISRPAGMSAADFQNGLANQDPTVLSALVAAPARPVTADPDRRFLFPSEWVDLHLASPATPGPVGHGYTTQNRDDGTLYYAFDITDEVLGISLDTVNRGGYAEGSIGGEQLAWLEQQLIAVHSRYLDTAGNEVAGTPGADKLVLLFSHHNIATMENPFLDPEKPSDRRVLGAEVEAFLHRFPNVVGWINGHSHVNRIWARPDASGKTGGFWEINTAAHIDYPEHARIIELVDNGDGTLSFFATLIDHAGPASAPAGSTDVLSLAAISRELSANDPQSSIDGPLGEMVDRNVELVIRRPYDRQSAAPTPTPAPSPAPTTAPDQGQQLPATGAGTGAAVLGAAAIAGAAALRRREGPRDEAADG